MINSVSPVFKSKSLGQTLLSHLFFTGLLWTESSHIFCCHHSVLLRGSS